jgi:multidrug resistance efflux pump
LRSVGTQVISLVPLPNVWVIANYKETQMTNIRTGQKARVTVDAFPGKVLGCMGTMRAPVSAAFNGSARRKDKDARKMLDLIRAKRREEARGLTDVCRGLLNSSPDE